MQNKCELDSYDDLSEQEKEAIWDDLFPNYSEGEISDQLEGEWEEN